MHLVRPVRLETEHQQARARRHGKLDGKRQSRDSVMKPEKSGVISTDAVPVAQDRIQFGSRLTSVAENIAEWRVKVGGPSPPGGATGREVPG